MNSTSAGYRLRRVEVRNWGTFTGDRHYVMDLGCTSACLTGLNGSGKSTLVDALLTLLVPHEFRSYNVAATGNGAKRERSLRTYILGAYGKEESPESNRGQSRFLRKPGLVSVLLAVFHDAVFVKSMTLLQLHWITASGEHAARYLCREGEVSIGELGLARISVSNFKDHFEGGGWTYETAFEPYEGHFMKALRIPSRQALKLFCRTVSVKDVPSVTEFIRGLMLEPFPVTENLNAIESHFSDLDRIHTQLQQTAEEIELLKPVESHYAAHKEASEEVTRLTTVKGAAEIVLARDAGLVIGAELATLQQKLVTTEAEITRLNGDLEVLKNREVALRVDMGKDETGAAIAKLQAEEKSLATELAAARRARDELRQWLTLVGYKEGLPSPDTFAAMKGWAAGELERCSNEQSELLKQSGAKAAEASAVSESARLLGLEIQSLDGKRDKIPGVFRAMRQKICEDLQLDESTLPFVGELVDVPAHEREWRESLEVLLHGFALSIPVPQEHHARFSSYVEHSKFRKRLVYYAAPKGNAPAAKLDATRAYGKLVLRPDTWCRAWLMERLIADFPHRCTPTMPEFLAEKGPALTRNRHIKGGIRFSKEGTDTERDYDLLGWSNTAKLSEMRKKLEVLHAQARSLKKQSESLEQGAKSLKSGMTLLEKVALFSVYRVIDEAGISAELTAATDRRKELEATNDRWRALNDALQETLKEQEIVAKQEGDARETLGGTKADIEQWTKKRKDYANTFNAAALNDFDWKPWEPQVEKFREGEPLVISSFEKQIGRINRAIATALQRQKDRAAETGAPLTAAIARFLEATKARGYATTWRADASSAPALVTHLRNLIEENFSSLRKEFVAMMRKVLLDDLRIGEGDLQVQRRQNSERIEELNQTLAEIPYNEDTRIQIVTRPSREQAVITYREKLDNCTKHSLALSDEQLQEKFKAVKALVTYIREKRSDAEKGADPNNWDTFALLENKPGADPKDGEWHSDADGNSGGQKAKLACTIVAAAMAFQLKHTRTKQSNAFRLVMVDEIFSKSDDVNSAYALAVFEKFDFQLLLVTPRDGRLKLVQPYVGSFHLAQNPTRGASSLTSLTRVEVAGETDAPETDADAG